MISKETRWQDRFPSNTVKCLGFERPTDGEWTYSLWSKEVKDWRGYGYFSGYCRDVLEVSLGDPDRGWWGWFSVPVRA